MTKKENIERLDSCLNKAKDDEPIFVLRAKDSAASAIVREWARKRMMLGLNSWEDQKIKDALLVADSMRTWRLANGNS